MQKIIILDFTTGNTHILDYDNNIYDKEDIHIFFEDVENHFGYIFTENQCQWMIVDTLRLIIE
jgi:hypothetical protein